MKLIITAGMPGAGKEEFLNAASNTGIQFARMGDAVREYYAKRNIGDEKLSTGEFANIERQRYGFDVWAKRTVEKLKGDVFIIDGCRSRDEIAAFKGITKDVYVIGIYSSPKTRYERLIKRNREDAPKNKKEFEERDEREISWGLADTLALADYLIVNEGTLEEFKSEVRTKMEDFCK